MSPLLHTMRRGGDLMAQKDIAEKMLEAYNDVFADIVNVLLFGGKEVMTPDSLEEQEGNAFYKAEGKLHSLERDVVKRWKDGSIRIACIGFENQTKPDADMPLRVIGYDGAEYRSQLSRDGKQRDRYPVVTLVLYFGCEGHWDAPLTLKERVKIPEGLEPFVNDYKINLFEIAYLSKEQIQMFRSDFRFVADFFVQMRETGDYRYKENRMKMRHMTEVFQLFAAMTNDRKYEEGFWKYTGKEEVNTVRNLFDIVEDRGREEGRKEAQKEYERDKRDTALSLREFGMPEEAIAKSMKVNIETVRRWLTA